MAHILNQIMSKYHCTKCNKEAVMRNSEKTVNAICCDGEKPTSHKLGKAPIKTEPTAEAIKGSPVQPPKEPAPQVTKLDQPLSGVKAKAN